MRIVGDRCFVSEIDPGSDAEKQGLKIGDEVMEAGGFVIGRSNFWKFQYLYRSLRPQPGVKVTIQSPTGERRELALSAKVIEGKQQINLSDFNEYQDMVRKSETAERLDRDRYQKFANDLLIWKMNEFDLTDEKIDQAFDKAKNFKALILDLRDNGGGYVTNIQRLLGNLFDHDVKIGDEKMRKETKPLIAKSRGDKAYKGKLVVLVNAASASASEVFSRVIQIEKRGVIVGDQTAGAVMTSRRYSKSTGLGAIVFYGVSITESDLIMTDGNSLEKKGVTPDNVVLPTGAEIAGDRDVVLSKAASLVGVDIDPEKAGKLFPRIIKPH
jgi:C-terminal processing protease CtpA/Prc